MCSKPQQLNNGTIIACRKCNDCIAGRKNDWVARCMAEKATSSEVLAMGLTYRNKSDGAKPDAAKAFRYKDIQDFLKWLREEYFRHYGERGEIRYVIAGERGSQNGRVHWHLILFSDRPISILGDWFDEYHKPIQGMLLDTRVHWQYWPHGHLVSQVPDQGGMMYVLKYILKDQFNIVNSKGTMREAKSELSGASMFRMSKVPPIGMRWLEKKVADWRDRGIVPVSLNLRIPEYTGYWWPKGQFREYLLDEIWAINDAHKKEHGKDCAQWSALISSLLSDDAALDVLYYGPHLNFTEEERLLNEQAQTREFKRQYDDKRRKDAIVEDFHRRAKKCSSLLTCRPCFDGLTVMEKRAYRWWYGQQIEEQKNRLNAQGKCYKTEREAKKATAKYLEGVGELNPWCDLKASLTGHQKNVARRKAFTENYCARRKKMFEEARSRNKDAG